MTSTVTFCLFQTYRVTPCSNAEEAALSADFLCSHSTEKTFVAPSKIDSISTDLALLIKMHERGICDSFAGVTLAFCYGAFFPSLVFKYKYLKRAQLQQKVGQIKYPVSVLFEEITRPGCLARKLPVCYLSTNSSMHICIVSLASLSKLNHQTVIYSKCFVNKYWNSQIGF